MNVKKSILLLIVSLTAFIAVAQWRTCFQGTDINNRVTGLSFYTPSTGYVATRKWVGYTTDSGRTVSKRFVTLSNVDYGTNNVGLTLGFAIEGVKAFSADTLLVYGDYGFEPSILYSLNGGSTWKLVYHKNIRLDYLYLTNTVADMVFPGNGSAGFAVQGDEIIKSMDRGKTWQTISVQLNQQMFKLSFVDVNTGYAAGSRKIFKTINSGNAWNTLTGTPTNIKGISAPVESSLFINANGDNYYSSNGGMSFTLANTEAGKQYAEDVVYLNDSTGYATSGYNIFQSRNKGKSWELMPGSNSFSYLNYGYRRLFFYNNMQAWACGENEYLSITTNGGGTSLLKAVFDYDASNTCVTNTVQLLNQSQQGYNYRWLKNGVQFATTYNASYTVTGTKDTVQLIVQKDTLKDTMTKTISANTSSAFSLNSRPVKDTVCSNGAVNFEIKNSVTDVQYQVGRLCCGNSLPVYGNGGTLTISSFANGYEDTTSNFTVTAFRNGACGLQTLQNIHPIRIINSFPATGAVSDTICTQKMFNITVPNSRLGYQYWTDVTLPKVNGTGGSIQLPTRVEVASSTYPVGVDKIFTHYEFNLYTWQAQYGCGINYPITTVAMVGRNTSAGFTTNSHEMLTNSNFTFIDHSIQANTYLWTFSTGANNASSTFPQPPNISFNQPGIKLIQQKTITKEGCIDSANRYVEIFSSSPVNNSTLCTVSATSQATDSIRKRYYFTNRAFYEDEFGNRIVGGSFIKFQPIPFFYIGCYAAKFDKTGALLWFLQDPIEEDYFAYNNESHLIIEQIISDKLGYTYLLGHSFYWSYIKDGNNKFHLPSRGGFIMKVNPSGKIIWVRALYNKDLTGMHTSQDYTGGSLLRGKNDEIYVVTHCNAGSALENFMSGDEILANGSDNKTGIIIQYDTEGNVVRKKSFPITYNNLRYGSPYDRLPSATWDSTGKLVIYGILNTAEMSGNTIDGFNIPFNTTNVKSALLFVDTTNLRVVSIKPLYTRTSSGNTTIYADSYAIDSNGNYYAGYTTKIPFPRSTQIYQFDTLKYKSFIEAYDANGNHRWKKQLEGLQPLNLLAYPQQLKVYGTNYIGPTFSYNPNNASPTTFDVKKLTAVTDSASYTGEAKTGLGSIDNVVATLASVNGSMQHMASLGTTKEEAEGTMKRGYGDQVWVTGTVGLHLRNIIDFSAQDTASTLMTYKLPVTTNCATSYSTMSNYIKFDMIRNQTNCIDSTFNINWSGNGVSQVNLSYSTNNGTSFTPIASNVDAAAGLYLFNAIQAGINGSIIFKIQSNSSSLSDTNRLIIYAMPSRAYPNNMAYFCPYDTGISLSGAMGVGYKYKWNTGDTSRSIHVQNIYREPFYDNVLFVPRYYLTTTTSTGCARIEEINIAPVPHYGIGGVPIISLNATGDSLKSNLCGLTHVWYKDGLEQTGITSCKIKPNANGVYRAATRHPVSGCTTWKSNSINMTVTSVTTLPPDVESIGIMPNPAHGHAFLKIQVKKAVSLQINLLDAKGRTALVTPIQKVPSNISTLIPLNITGLAAGLYFVRIFINGVTIYTRLTIL